MSSHPEANHACSAAHDKLPPFKSRCCRFAADHSSHPPNSIPRHCADTFRRCDPPPRTLLAECLFLQWSGSSSTKRKSLPYSPESDDRAGRRAGCETAISSKLDAHAKARNCLRRWTAREPARQLDQIPSSSPPTPPFRMAQSVEHDSRPPASSIRSRLRRWEALSSRCRDGTGADATSTVR